MPAVHRITLSLSISVALFAATHVVRAQDVETQRQLMPSGGPPDLPPDAPRMGPGGMMGGPGGPFGSERKLVKQFDANGDGWLNADERAAARQQLKQDAANGGGGFPGGARRRGPGGGPGGGPPPPGMGDMGGEKEPVGPGPHVSPDQVKTYPDAGLYESSVLRTLFMEFEDADWETELSDFYNTDVDVPCTLTVDGVKYPGVGVHFRGASSYMMVGPGHKRSFNLSMDMVDGKQRLLGVKTLNLLNAHEDPSFLSSVLYSHIARQYVPAPRANFVKVVINGESWGVYANLEQFNKDFLEENYHTAKGARWKVQGSPMAQSGLDYIGDDIEPYRSHYQIKSGDDLDDWKALVELCRTLSETPLDQLEEKLRPILDIDGALWFLALDVALVNCDGYWIRSSDYSLYRDPKGVFHLIPHDMNEAFVSVINAPGFGGRGGPGMRGRPGQGGGRGPGGPEAAEAAGSRPPLNPQNQDWQPGLPQQRGGNATPTGITLDPMIAMNDARKPLRSRLLAVPGLRAKYLENIRIIAADSLAWEHLGPVVAQYRALVQDEIKADTRKLTSYAAFEQVTSDEPPAAPAESVRPVRSLRSFADGRSQFLLDYVQKSPASTDAGATPKRDADARREPGQ